MSPDPTVDPIPSDEEAAAIVAALELLWPQPVGADESPGRVPAWRFAGRWWVHNQGWPRREY